MSDGKLNFAEEKKTNYEKITCPGLTFKNDEERREYFRNELRKKLPDLKKIEGYPIGEDEDIIALSDPPYYTACPNPWLNDFIEEWGKLKDNVPGRKKDFKVDEPYASDISEGKNNPIYNAHSYHTKVPHPAIMRYILHYTQPGDIVFDGFAGTGMTGVAAQMCGNPDSETKTKIEREWKKAGKGKPNWGVRNAILGDLSSIASFIAYNYNTPIDVEEFNSEAKRIIEEVEDECGWMYKTIPASVKDKEQIDNFVREFKKCKTAEEAIKFFESQKSIFGKINYTVWSDVFICSECGSEIVFWDVAVNKQSSEVNNEFNCKSCNALHTKRSVERAWITNYDMALGKTIKQNKTVPVLINYSLGTKRFEKSPDLFDLQIINLIEKLRYNFWVPTDPIILGDKTRELKRCGINNINQIHFARSLHIISNYYQKFSKVNPRYIFIITSLLLNSSKMFRWRPNNRSGILTGTIYVPSNIRESNVNDFLRNKLKIYSVRDFKTIISTHSANAKLLKENYVDYIFTDPPFGANIMYSELNFLWECWLKVKTNNKSEAIENSTQHKGFLEYQDLMLKCFKEYYRILKYGKWMTVEFSNTSAAVWNGIQTSLQRAGFIVANVAALDKQQGSFNAVTSTTAVKQDLIISCYKTSEEFEKNFKEENIDISTWEFVEEHLRHLPLQIQNDEKRTAVVERSSRILYDRLISFFLMRGLPIPIDAGDFQVGLKQKFDERDGMYFTKEQSAEYDELYEQTKGEQFVLVFDEIYSESDAVLWLRERLQKTPQTYQDIMPDFRKANRVNRKGEFVAELITVLEENFIQESNGQWRIPNMNESKDREAIRNKSLLKEFDKYMEELDNPKTKKIKEVRVEALRAGFKMCWEKKDFKTIVNLGDKIPQNILLEDEQLLMFYDIAKDRI